jgi:hypothetical protein
MSTKVINNYKRKENSIEKQPTKKQKVEVIVSSDEVLAKPNQRVILGKYIITRDVNKQLCNFKISTGENSKKVKFYCQEELKGLVYYKEEYNIFNLMVKKHERLLVEDVEEVMKPIMDKAADEEMKCYSRIYSGNGEKTVKYLSFSVGPYTEVINSQGEIINREDFTELVKNKETPIQISLTYNCYNVTAFRSDTYAVNIGAKKIQVL